MHRCSGDDSYTLNGLVTSGTHPNRRFCHRTVHRLARRQMHLGFEPDSNRFENLVELGTPLIHDVPRQIRKQPQPLEADNGKQRAGWAPISGKVVYPGRNGVSGTWRWPSPGSEPDEPGPDVIDLTPELLPA